MLFIQSYILNNVKGSSVYFGLKIKKSKIEYIPYRNVIMFYPNIHSEKIFLIILIKTLLKRLFKLVVKINWTYVTFLNYLSSVFVLNYITNNYFWSFWWEHFLYKRWVQNVVHHHLNIKVSSVNINIIKNEDRYYLCSLGW